MIRKNEFSPWLKGKEASKKKGLRLESRESMTQPGSLYASLGADSNRTRRKKSEGQGKTIALRGREGGEVQPSSY